MSAAGIIGWFESTDQSVDTKITKEHEGHEDKQKAARACPWALPAAARSRPQPERSAGYSVGANFFVFLVFAAHVPPSIPGTHRGFPTAACRISFPKMAFLRVLRAFVVNLSLFDR
jgi:hypothetical protein